MKLQWTLALWVAAVLSVMAFGLWAVSRPYAFHGAVIEPPIQVADLTLTAQDGRPFRLGQQAGKIAVLFFGYTSCPDICPTTMADLKRVQVLLAAQADRAQFVFVTVDPERDTPERLEAYVKSFDPTFVGLTGTNAELDPVWRAFGVYRARQASNGALGYLMDHSATIYVLDTRGNLRETFSNGETAENMAHDLGHLLSDAP